MLADLFTSKEPVTSFTGFLMVTKCDVKQDKRGRPYLALTLGDRTGSIEARYWDNGSPTVLGSLYKVQAEVSEYNGELQLKIVRWRPVNEDDTVEPEHFLRASEHNRDDLLAGVYSFIGMIHDHDLANVVLTVVERYKALLRDAPAAKANHQPYLGGLLEHIHNLGKLVCQVCDLYSMLDRDVLLAACILHDIGKVQELETSPVIRYTRRGTLIGHIALGLQMISEAKGVLTTDRLDHLEHIIVSHHGRQDWGSPVEPMSREAMVFHQLDMIDSRMGFFDELKFNGEEFLFHKGQNYWAGTNRHV